MLLYSFIYINILLDFLLSFIAITINKMMHTIIIVKSPKTTPVIGPTSSVVAISSLEEDEVNEVILTVSKH